MFASSWYFVLLVGGESQDTGRGGEQDVGVKTGDGNRTNVGMQNQGGEKMEKSP
jgi:hypothetical protein